MKREIISVTTFGSLRTLSPFSYINLYIRSYFSSGTSPGPFCFSFLHSHFVEMPSPRTPALLLLVLLVGTGYRGGVAWDGGVGLGWVPEIGHDVWGDAPGLCPPKPGLWPLLSPTGEPARPGKPLPPHLPLILSIPILHSTFHSFNFQSLTKKSGFLFRFRP